jgi:hypothetical protein
MNIHVTVTALKFIMAQLLMQSRVFNENKFLPFGPILNQLNLFHPFALCSPSSVFQYYLLSGD